jgi:hypothetical protein
MVAPTISRCSMTRTVTDVAAEEAGLDEAFLAFYPHPDGNPGNVAARLSARAAPGRCWSVSPSPTASPSQGVWSRSGWSNSRASPNPGGVAVPS